MQAGLPNASSHILITKSIFNSCHIKVGLSHCIWLNPEKNIKLGYEISKMCCHQLPRPPWFAILYVGCLEKMLYWMLQYGL